MYKENFSVKISDYSDSILILTVHGPPNTAYEGGQWDVQLDWTQFTKPPKLTMLTPIYNPLIDSDGNINSHELNHFYSPALAPILAVIGRWIQLLMLQTSQLDTEEA